LGVYGIAQADNTLRCTIAGGVTHCTPTVDGPADYSVTGNGSNIWAARVEGGSEVNLIGGTISGTGPNGKAVYAGTGGHLTTTGVAISTTGNDAHAVQSWVVNASETAPRVTLDSGTTVTTS